MIKDVITNKIIQNALGCKKVIYNSFGLELTPIILDSEKSLECNMS